MRIRLVAETPMQNSLTDRGWRWSSFNRTTHTHFFFNSSTEWPRWLYEWFEKFAGL